jgi:predicted nucleic acid-binding protein
MAVLAMASERLEITEPAEKLAQSLQGIGINPMDAVHLSLASAADADYFSTTDDKLLKKASTLKDLGCKVLSLLNLVAEIV